MTESHLEKARRDLLLLFDARIREISDPDRQAAFVEAVAADLTDREAANHREIVSVYDGYRARMTFEERRLFQRAVDEDCRDQVAYHAVPWWSPGRWS